MGTYGLHVPASRVGYVPEAQGGLPPGPRVLTRYVPRTVAPQALRLAGCLSPQVVSGLCAVGALCMLVLSRRTRAFYKRGP